MAEHEDTPHRAYDPLTDERPRRRRKSGGLIVALAVVLLAHVALLLYLYKAKFEAHFRDFTDQATKVAIVKPPPPQIQPHVSPTPPPPNVAPPPALVLPPPTNTPPVFNTPPVLQRQPDPPAPVTTPPPKAPAVITNPDWLRRPTNEDMVRYYPPRANTLEKEGSATISCVVTEQGTMSNCRVVSETPSGFQFGDAALKMSKIFKMRPKTEDGRPVGGASWSTTIRFKLS
jgi:protein TonB